MTAITPDVIDAFVVSRPRTAPGSYNHLLGTVTRLFDWLVARTLVLRSPVQAKPRRTSTSRIPFLFDPPTARRLLDDRRQLLLPVADNYSCRS